MKKLLFTIFLLLSLNQGFSQSILSKNYKRYSLDLDLGLNSFHGDIKGKAGFTFATKFNWHLTSAFAANASLDFGTINGNDKTRLNSFSNSYVQMMFGGEAYLFNILGFNVLSNKFQPFIGIGFGGLSSNIKKSSISEIVSTEKNSGWAFCWQFTGGAKLKINNSFDINAKLSLNNTKTDFIDNYKPIVAANRGNDAFGEYTIGLTYHFGKAKKTSLIWKQTNNTFFGIDLTQKRGRNNNNNQVNSNQESSSEKRQYINLENPTTDDIDDNEFDCIIKF